MGIPNSRLRYYLIARKRSVEAGSNNVFESLPEGKIIEEFPGIAKNIQCEALETFMEEGNRDDDGYLVGDDVLRKRAEVFDIVTAQSNNSCCFTKSYGRYTEGTGKKCSDTDVHSIIKVMLHRCWLHELTKNRKIIPKLRFLSNIPYLKFEFSAVFQRISTEIRCACRLSDPTIRRLGCGLLAGQTRNSRGEARRHSEGAAPAPLLARRDFAADGLSPGVVQFSARVVAPAALQGPGKQPQRGRRCQTDGDHVRQDLT